MERLIRRLIPILLILAAHDTFSLKVVWRDEDPAVQVVYALNVCGPMITVNGTTFEQDKTALGSNQCFGDFQSFSNYRKSDSPFHYDLPVPTDGHYALHLKFGNATQQVFDVYLNGVHKLLEADSFFEIAGERLLFKGEQTIVTNGSVRLEFRTTSGDAQVSAILLVKGELSDLEAGKWISGGSCSGSE
jgi:Malectin domain